jgi:hypothetical protein
MAMTTSYETHELISDHHAEVERLCAELLELGSRVAADEKDAAVLCERARALGWRLREHLTTESAALMNDAGGDRQRLEALLDLRREEGERIARGIAAAERKASAPLELVNAVCSIARGARATLDRAAHA